MHLQQWCDLYHVTYISLSLDLLACQPFQLCNGKATSGFVINLLASQRSKISQERLRINLRTKVETKWVDSNSVRIKFTLTKCCYVTIHTRCHSLAGFVSTSQLMSLVYVMTYAQSTMVTVVLDWIETVKCTQKECLKTILIYITKSNVFNTSVVAGLCVTISIMSWWMH